ncbi:molybdopterin-binding oxidoreductase [Fibrisoma montanum]|uniref:Molybdopterin-binding oxidoreductase n=1 Tax=Fibrisoma montanum TaxID=2305895 RepID=A0A418M185_9BACT|nr:molybdopterin-dependent oxidoreductase [Fibrisoma montanum]RIV19374.1 molybdopterin-binding oxidoreductase [Fibrisoma montanum]
MKATNEPDLPESDLPESVIRRRTLKAFGWFALASVVPVGVYTWIQNSPNLAGIRKPLRKVLDVNEDIASTYFSSNHLVRTYPVEAAARVPRVNGFDGLRTPLPDDWKLQIDRQGSNGEPQEPLLLTMDDVKALPRQELVYDFKCVEGWSQIQHWSGVRFSDFMERYQLGTRSGKAPSPDTTDDLYKFVGMETPDKGYYVGIDMESAMHPQTLLAYELNGEPINNQHGAPVRLLIPHKYGVKNLKRIGRIFFSDTRPRDFWAERGYDYYLGL